MKIQKFCSRLARRYIVKFEHYRTCILKEDLDSQKTEEEWLEYLVDYVKSNPITDENPEN